MNKDLVMAACAALVLALAGCTTIPAAPTQSKVPEMCRVFSPIVPSLDDSLTDSTANQLLVHNCVGYQLGCWQSDAMKDACSF